MSKKDKNPYKEPVALDITGLAFGGKGVAHIEGKVVFVENAIPGQKVMVHIYKNKKDYAEGRAVKTVTQSPLYEEPKCAHFFVCGGCSLQNLQYDEQLKHKRQWVADSLERIGKLKNLNITETVPSEDVFFYRNKMEYTFSSKIWDAEEKRIAKDRFGLGMHLSGRFDTIFDITDCRLQSEKSNKIVNTIRDFTKESGLAAYDIRNQTGFWRHVVIREGKISGQTMINLITYSCESKEHEIIDRLREKVLEAVGSVDAFLHAEHPGKSQAAVWKKLNVLHGQEFITDSLGENEFRIDADTFFQTNTKQAGKLYEQIAKFGDFTGNETVYDLFSGVGTIPIYISKMVKKVLGIEVVGSSVEAAIKNAERAEVDNCKFLQGKVRVVIKDRENLYHNYGKPDVVITDPPRSGLDPKTIMRIIGLEAPRLIYVSCNPATLARDLIEITEFYSVAEVVPVDMFPHTAHVETVVKLDRRENVESGSTV